MIITDMVSSDGNYYIIRIKAPIGKTKEIIKDELVKGIGCCNIDIFYYPPEKETRILVREFLFDNFAGMKISKLVNLESEYYGVDYT